MKIVMIALLVFCVGCSTMKPVPEAPDVDTQIVKVEVPCIIQIDEINEPEYPEYPSRESYADAKAWAKEVRRVHKLIQAKMRSYIDALKHQISEHNRLEPKCSESPPQ
jgi:hypothetical protein